MNKVLMMLPPFYGFNNLALPQPGWHPSAGKHEELPTQQFSPEWK
jgi:hypothetical protein